MMLARSRSCGTMRIFWQWSFPCDAVATKLRATLRRVAVGPILFSFLGWNLPLASLSRSKLFPRPTKSTLLTVWRNLPSKSTLMTTWSTWRTKLWRRSARRITSLACVGSLHRSCASVLPSTTNSSASPSLTHLCNLDVGKFVRSRTCFKLEIYYYLHKMKPRLCRTGFSYLVSFDFSWRKEVVVGTGYRLNIKSDHWRVLRRNVMRIGRCCRHTQGYLFSSPFSAQMRLAAGRGGTESTVAF